MKIRAKTGEIIDLSDIRKEQVYIGNPYAVEVAILIKHNTALLDALEAALRVPRRGMWDKSDPVTWNAALDAVEEAAGVIVERVR